MNRILPVLAALLAPLALPACSTVVNGRDQAISVAEEHPIAVDSQVVTLTLSVGDEAGLSAVDRARVRAFAQSYLVNGHGPVSVTTPGGSGDDLAAGQAAADARAALDAAGVDAADVQAAGYRSGEARRDLVLSYVRYVATASECGVWTGTLVRDFRNLRSPNYGCATQNNLAAMVADPHDLVEPAAESPADSNARSRMIDAFRKGEKTASAVDGDIKADVAK